MALLFIVENNVAKPTTEVLLIEPFKTIWERDTTPHKTRAIREFTFIEFIASKKATNPYAGYSDEERWDKLVALYFEEAEPDNAVEQGLAKMVEFQQEASPTLKYYLSVLGAAEKMRNFFDNVDINERNFKSGVPVYKPADITRAINDTDKVLQNLHSIKERVEQELFEQSKTKGNKRINPFEV